ncbi:MAG: fumarate hydratase [bacterium]
MRRIEREKFVEIISSLCKEINYSLPLPIIKALIKARENEKDERPREVLSILIENARIAKEKCVPICQDTGSVIVFLEIGRDLRIDFDINSSVQEGVGRGYKEGYLRQSIVSSPFERKNTGDNTPAIIHINLIDGESLQITLFAKGAGSENQGGLFMLKPSDREKIEDIVVSYVKEKAPYACPPIMVGIGIGGDMEIACLLSKKAILRDIGRFNENLAIAQMEKNLLFKINNLGIGSGGLGGMTTALCVNIEVASCHIGSLPLAINFGCYATRYKRITI